MNNVIVIHEFGAPEHYYGAQDFLVKNAGSIKYREFSTPLLVYRALKSRSFSKMLKAFSDFFYLLFCYLFPSILKGKTVILGCAPLDWRICLLKRCLKHSKIIYHTSWLSWDGSKYPKNIPCLEKYLTKVWKEFLGKSVHHIAAVTPEVKRQLIENFSVPEYIIQVVYHCFNNEIFKITDDFSNVDINHKQLNVIFVGRLVEEKGVREIISLAQSLPNNKFYIVGKGKLEDELKQAAEKQKNLEFIGYVANRDKLAELFRSSDILLQMSKKNSEWEELFGMAIIEAMACGVVPIATDHVGPNTILSDNEILCENIVPEDGMIDIVCEKIKYYDTNREYLLKCKNESVKVADLYSLPNISKRWSMVLGEK
ncbi:glycosyltransferase [Vibrio sp. Vf1514]|uniref:glycosyltransferase n=1 Tax=Vibrio sp. Vf1514 TaxID=3437381 RepID=UPI003F8BFF13